MPGQSSLHLLRNLDDAFGDGTAAADNVVRSNGPHSLLLTKLQPPLLPRDNVLRPRLVNALRHVLDWPLTLVSAPAGFGKSTLVAQALVAAPAPCAWLTLDEYDNDLGVFLDYLIAAIQTQFPEACAQTQRLLRALQPPPVDTIVASLLNEIQAIAAPFIVVLDDFHSLTDPAINELFATLLRALPTSLHLVVITQVDPGWPLARLAGRGQVLEIRATDLRFRFDEARAFLETATGRPLPADTVTFLVEHTEGWIVALRLAALSLVSEPDRAAHLRDLKPPEDHFVPRFLVHEVLARQSPVVRDFLLRTCILDRLSAPLCAALLAPSVERPTSESIAAWLRDTNLFIVPLGEAGGWYRYHHLFRDLLRREMAMQWDAERIANLHRQASDWYAANGLAEEALRHALAAGDSQHAAEIVGSQVHAYLNHEDWRGVERSLSLLPDHVIRQRPSLLLARAWVAGMRQDGHSIAPLLAAASAMAADSESVLSQDERTVARAELAALQAYALWWGEGQAQVALDSAREALAGLPRGYAFARSIGLHVKGLATYASGRPAEGIEMLRRSVDDPDEPPVVKTRLLLALVTIYRVAGPLYELQDTIDLHLKTADEHDLHASRLWARYVRGSLHYERNELDEAVKQFEAAAEQRYLAHFLCGRDTLVELALAYQAQGQTGKAQDTARDLARYCVERAGENPAESRALQVRLALARRDVDEALRVAASLPAAASASALFFTSVPAIPRAQALLASGGVRERQQAQEMLDALEAGAEGAHTLRPLVKILALQALALVADRRDGEAQAKLERAVALAEPMGLIRTFVDVGPALAPLLQRLRERDVAPAYLREVLAAFATEVRAAPMGQLAKDGILIEPLTERESEVLRLMEQRLSTKEMASQLCVAPGTAKRHVSNVMAKLGAHTRREAVQRAQAVGLLPPR